MKILIVEDDGDNARSMADALHLTRSNHLSTPGKTPVPSDLKIKIAQSHAAALDAIKKGFRPNALLVDLHLGDDPRGGVKVLRDVIESRVRDRIGIVILTGYELSNPCDIPSYAAVINKPAHPRTVLDALEQQAEGSSTEIPRATS